MSERNGYEPGVPCWVDTRQPDPRAAADFYTRLFDWEAETSGDYTFCRLRGRDVAAIAAGDAAAWTTHIWVDSADETAARVSDAGGRVVTAPYDLPGVGRTAVARRPRGRRVLRLAAGRAQGRPARQRAGRLGHERAEHPRPRGREGVLRHRLRVGDRHVRRRRHRGDALAPPRLRRR